MIKIESLQNPLVKKIRLLKEKSRVRRQEGLFVLEGVRELSLAIKGGFEIEKLLYYPNLISLDVIQKKTGNTAFELIKISRSVYEKLVYRDTTEGIIALVKAKRTGLQDIHFRTKKPLILVAEAPEKPGNIGALLRTADAVNVDCVLIANPKTDLYNPNIIRSSVGCLFTNIIAAGSTEEIISFLKNHEIQLFAAALHKDAEIYSEQDFTKGAAIVVGTEDTGLSDSWLRESKKIIIPMRGAIDSLNVSVSAGILLYEADRQRSL